MHFLFRSEKIYGKKRYVPIFERDMVKEERRGKDSGV